MYKCAASIMQNNMVPKGKGNGRALVIAPLSRHCHHRGTQVHGVHQAASHIPVLYLPSRSRYHLPTPRGWRDGGLSKPRLRVQRATGPRLLCDRLPEEL